MNGKTNNNGSKRMGDSLMTETDLRGTRGVSCAWLARASILPHPQEIKYEY
jgi:hypothetical protein